MRDFENGRSKTVHKKIYKRKNATENTVCETSVALVYYSTAVYAVVRIKSQTQRRFRIDLNNVRAYSISSKTGTCVSKIIKYQ